MNRRRLVGLITGLLALLAFPARAEWGDEIIYFVMIDRFADGDGKQAFGIEPDNPLAFHGGDLQGLTQHLDEIDELGATAVWITPVAKQVETPIVSAETGGLFHGHHGYWAEDLSGMDPRFGTEADLRALADDLHARGMKLMLDVVYNHLGTGTALAQDPERRTWIRQGEACGGDAVTACIYGLPDFRTENPQVADYVLEQQISLAERVGADGFRLDTFKHLDTAFWHDHRAAVRARLGESFYLLGELWGADKYEARPHFAEDLVDGFIDFGFRKAVYDYLRGVWTGDKLGRYLAGRHRVEAGHHLAPFLSSHDMPLMLAQLRGDTDRLKIGFALLLTASGPPILTWGEEVGRRGGVWPDNRGDMPWGDRAIEPGAGLARDEGLRRFVQALIAWRKAHPDLSRAEPETLLSTTEALVFSKGACTVVGINRGDAALDLSDLAAQGLLGEPVLASVEGAAGEGGTAATALPAVSARLWTRCGG